jgi:hypothetical protein
MNDNTTPDQDPGTAIMVRRMVLVNEVRRRTALHLLEAARAALLRVVPVDKDELKVTAVTIDQLQDQIDTMRADNGTVMEEHGITIDEVVDAIRRGSSNG